MNEMQPHIWQRLACPRCQGSEIVTLVSVPVPCPRCRRTEHEAEVWRGPISWAAALQRRDREAAKAYARYFGDAA